MNSDISAKLVDQVTQACSDKTPLAIRAGGSKSFYGNAVDGTALDVTGHTGIIDYRPSELVISARCGSLLGDIEKALAENKQMFAFEPLHHAAQTTLGGVVACGVSGPRRGYSFAVRDAVLGASIINGKGELLKFGGQVMKNVAGYDASRLMVGAQGTLGVLLDISIKVKPCAESNITLVFDKPYAAARHDLNNWLMQGLPIWASCYHDGRLHLRLSSTEGHTRKAQQLMGGEQSGNEIWSQLRRQTHDFFSSHKNLWRVSVPPSTPLFETQRPQLIEWNGALRWIDSDEEMFSIAAQHGGHATMYRPDGNHEADIFQPLPATMLALQQRIKHSFDPEKILNRGRLYRAL